MQIAAGSADISPARPVPLAGYFLRKGVSGGIDGRLEANFVLLRASGDGGTGDGLVGIVAIDALFGSDLLVEKIRAALPEGLRGITLIPVASHTHFAPALDRRKPRLGSPDEDHFDDVATRIATAMAKAVQAPGSWFDAAFRLGRTECRASVYRRIRVPRISISPPGLRMQTVLGPNPSVRHPIALELLVACDRSGPRAAIWSWPCHPVAWPHETIASADFPGVVRSALRDALGRPDLPVLYLPGAAGDIRPAITRSRWHPVSMAKYPLAFAPTFRRSTPALFEEFSSRVVAAAREAARTLTEITVDGPPVLRQSAIPLSELIDGFDPPPQDDPHAGPPRDLPLSAIVAPGLSILLVGAELCSTYLPLLPSAGQGIRLVSGYAGECFGYLPTDRQIAEGGLEGDWFFHRFSLPGRIRPRIETRVVREIAALLEG